MEALDGNAIAGRLRDVFGHEMTMARAECGSCGAATYVAEFAVYLEAPGTVARCRTCETIVMVLVERRGVNCVDLRGLKALSS
jgi:Family of unknown function (DUF6510)